MGFSYLVCSLVQAPSHPFISNTNALLVISVLSWQNIYMPFQKEVCMGKGSN